MIRRWRRGLRCMPLLDPLYVFQLLLVLPLPCCLSDFIATRNRPWITPRINKCVFKVLKPGIISAEVDVRKIDDAPMIAGAAITKLREREIERASCRERV